jgi:hypothetical protein
MASGFKDSRGQAIKKELFLTPLEPFLHLNERRAQKINIEIAALDTLLL